MENSMVSDIILRVRDTLADHNKERWSDDRLIRLIDEGQKDLARRAKILRKTTTVEIYDGEGIYSLPDDLMLLDRVLYNGEVLPLKSHLDLDRTKGSNWITHTGEPECVVYDKQNRKKLRLYPIPSEIDDTYTMTSEGYFEVVETVSDNYGIVTNVTNGVDLFDFDNEGYLEDIEYVVSPYGVISEVNQGDILSDDLGVTTDFDVIDYFFKECNTECDPYTRLSVDIDDYGLVSSIEDQMKDFGVRDGSYGITVAVEDTNTDSDYGLVSSWETEQSDFDSHNPDYGVVVGIEGLTYNSPYGVLTSLSSNLIDAEVFTSDYGITTAISESASSLDIYYIKQPNTIVSLDDDLEVGDLFNSALKYYVTGKALRDDMDTQNRTFGNEELGFYDRELTEALRDDRTDFTRNNTQYETNYRGAFNG